MQINPRAVAKLEAATRYGYYPYTTHAQRNIMSQVFLAEARRLLDQQAESTIKHAVEIYVENEITYEQYIDIIEQVSREEASRGASQGADYARNRTFDFAQQELESATRQKQSLTLSDALKAAEQNLKIEVQRHIENLKTMENQHKTAIREITRQQQDELIQSQERIVDQTKIDLDQIISTRLQVETRKIEKEIRVQEDLRPARDAARTAIAHVSDLEKKRRTHQFLKSGLVGLTVLVLLAILVVPLFLSFPQWIFTLALVVFILMLVILLFWKNGIAEEDIVKGKRHIALFQSQAKEYASLDEQERCALLVQNLLIKNALF